MKYSKFLTISLICLSLSGLVQAAESPVKVSGDLVWGDTQKKWTFLEGNVRIVQGSTVITAAKAEIDLDNKQVYIKKDVKLVHPDAIIMADSLNYDCKKKFGTFKGSVVMERLAGNKQQSNKDPFKLKCAELFFETETRNFNAKGEGKLEHKDFTGTAESIEYLDSTEELTFKDKALLKKPEGEEIKGDSVKVNLKEKSFIVEKNVTLNFQVEDETKEKSSNLKGKE